jgi:hypothetical protein
VCRLCEDVCAPEKTGLVYDPGDICTALSAGGHQCSDRTGDMLLAC